MEETLKTREMDAQQFNMDIMDGDSQAVILNASVQEGVRFSLYLEVHDGAFVAANLDAVRKEVSAFIGRVSKVASASGLPL